MEVPKKIRILEGIRQGKIGGGESYLLSLVENLDRSQFEPVVVSFTDGPMVERLRSLGIKTYVIHTEKPFDFRVWKRLKEVAEDESIDIVHAHGTRAASNMFWAAKKLNLPLVYTCHAWSFHRDQNPVVKRLRILGEQFLTAQADVNICGCNANVVTGKQLFKNFDALIINNAIDPERFNPYGVYKNIREELGIAGDEILIASVARFTLQKQPLKLIAAFADVHTKVPNTTLLMVGDGEQKEEAVKLIQNLNLQDKVILQPFRQDVPDVLAGVDIFVLPSLWEAFPIALLEAMSMGKAVIGTNVDGTPEIIEPEKNGLLIEVDGLEKNITAALLRLCLDIPLRKRLQQGALNSIYNRYNVETLARKNEEVYEKLVPDRINASLVR
jgi:glycosyltransferase involved in cell wall biosynthesis